ncbi:MAG: VanZ family protein [Propionibacteriaceae bacterium]|jgi:glycopeptide antibiotics resistance protein|nr:VanZ family protein [Propionibacteriaceae bacterium]
MLTAYGPSTSLAILLGTVLAVVAFLPVVAVRYRKAGRLRLIDWVLLLGCAIYFVALWTYTLVPVPETLDYTCVSANFHPFAFVDVIRENVARAGRFRLNDPMLLQVVFNIVLFMPLGGFLRLVFRRGAVFATVTGFIISGLIETTQLTGDWWIFPCSYRFFDVDDLSMNTLGALLGSLIVWPLVALLSKRVAPKWERVTPGRRFMGVFADLMVILFLYVPTQIAWRAVEVYLLQVSAEQIRPWVDLAVGAGVTLLVEGLWVFLDGRTCGEAIVDIRPVDARPIVLRRLVKYVTGVGGFILLLATDFPYSSVVFVVFCLVSFILLFSTRTHRGLTGLLSRMDMQPDPEPSAAQTTRVTE